MQLVWQHYRKINLNSDIARFRPPTSQTCLATNHKSKVVAGCEQFLQKVKRESSSIYFLQQNLYINVSECFAFYRPKANLFCIKRRKAPHVDVTPASGLFRVAPSLWYKAKLSAIWKWFFVSSTYFHKKGFALSLVLKNLKQPDLLQDWFQRRL